MLLIKFKTIQEAFKYLPFINFYFFPAALVPDRDVRVSVKALAVSCVGAAVALHPESFFSKLYKTPLEAMGEEYGMLQFTYSILIVCLGFQISEAASTLKTPNSV